jgi:hypothetical protein
MDDWMDDGTDEIILLYFPFFFMFKCLKKVSNC